MSAVHATIATSSSDITRISCACRLESIYREFEYSHHQNRYPCGRGARDHERVM